MPTMEPAYHHLIDRIQDYLRHAASISYEAVDVAPFQAFFHRTDDLVFFNYAIPDHDVTGDVSAPLQELRATFREYGRRPRWEYLEEFAPNLGSALQAAGFVEDARLQLMTCTDDALIDVVLPDGMEIVEVTSHSSRDDIYDFKVTQQRGFNPLATNTPTDEDIDSFIDTRTGNVSFLARIDGEAVSAGGFSTPFDGVCEIVGIATLAPFRRRGIASALTAHATRTAFERGVEVACLTAADAAAGHVYERIGYAPTATTLFYIEPDE
jgi:ribosomal protein S18 acetylase RimI-like enzyme